MDKNEEIRLKSKYPPPPNHYIKFDSPTSMKPPSLDLLSKLSSFKTFGSEFKTKRMDTFFNHVEMETLDRKDLIPEELVNEVPPSNVEFFKELLKDINYFETNIEIPKPDFNVFTEIKKEIKFLRERYLNFLKNLNSNIEACEADSCLIKISFQKIFFYLEILKKKHILKQLIDHFKSENQECDELMKKLNKNVKDTKNYLASELNNLKKSMEEEEI